MTTAAVSCRRGRPRSISSYDIRSGFDSDIRPSHGRYHRRIDSARRSLVTDVVAPPLDSQLPELPVTLILAEDDGFYGDESPSSWHKEFAETLPTEYGMSYGRFSMSPNTSNLDQAMQEMKNNLTSDATTFSASNVILVARGPWMSWMAQFYLQDLPLAGLVMVDPMLLDDQNGFNH